MPLKIVSLNVDSVVHKNRINALSLFLHENQIDICLIQETKLGVGNTFNIFGFDIIRNDFVLGCGGTAILIKNNIKYGDVSSFSNIFWSISCKIYFNNAWHSISSVYFPPRANVGYDVFRTFFLAHKNKFIGGDFNSRHASFGDSSCNQYGNFLVRAALDFGLNIHSPTTPTCYRSSSGSYIDKFISINSALLPQYILNLPSFSDHAGISCVFPGIDNHMDVPIRFAFDQINSVGFNKYVDGNIKRIVLPINCNISSDEIDSVLREFNSIISKAIRRFVPKQKSNPTN